MSFSGWDDDDDKAWAVIGTLLAIILVVIGGAVACEAQGSRPERPVYVKCQP